MTFSALRSDKKIPGLLIPWDTSTGAERLSLKTPRNRNIEPRWLTQLIARLDRESAYRRRFSFAVAAPRFTPGEGQEGGAGIKTPYKPKSAA